MNNKQQFLIDENISPEVVQIFQSANLDATHVNTLKTYKGQRVSDDQLRRLNIRKGFIIVTMDDDFVKSFVDRKTPAKMIYVFGFKEKPKLLHAFSEHIFVLSRLMEQYDFIEFSTNGCRLPFE